VNQQDPDGAYELLQSAKLIEQRNQGPNQENFLRWSLNRSFFLES